MMALSTTCLGYLNLIRHMDEGGVISVREALLNVGLQNSTVKHVMVGRGNDEVAPDPEMLEGYKKLGKIYSIEDLWPQYRENYLTQIRLSKEADLWMETAAEESLLHDVLLVCYEKDYLHCHRTLLAEEIVRRHPEVNYVGDLQLNTTSWMVPQTQSEGEEAHASTKSKRLHIPNPSQPVGDSLELEAEE